MQNCLTIELGLIGYAEAYALQKRVVAARKVGTIGDVLLFCEHPHVITLGRNGKREHLLAPESVLRQKGVEFCETDRGGDITYHGPGQMVGYPILDLGAIRRDVHWYVRMIEEVMIRTSAEFGVSARRDPGRTGVWVEVAEEDSSLATRLPAVAGHSPLATSEKLGAIGVHLSRWVTSHGFAYNVTTDLRYFDLIVPCGIAERKATSLEKILRRGVKKSEVEPTLTKHFGEVFGLEMRWTTRTELMDSLAAAELPEAVPA